MSERYTPQIGDNFSSLYSVESGTTNNNNLSFQDNSYLQGNVVASISYRVTDDPNSAVYTWGAFDEAGSVSSLGISFTELALDNLFIGSESGTEVLLMPQLGEGEPQLPKEDQEFDASGETIFFFPMSLID